jgi:hypothetical protein
MWTNPKPAQINQIAVSAIPEKAKMSKISTSLKEDQLGHLDFSRAQTTKGSVTLKFP